MSTINQTPTPTNTRRCGPHNISAYKFCWCIGNPDGWGNQLYHCCKQRNSGYQQDQTLVKLGKFVCCVGPRSSPYPCGYCGKR